MSKKLYMEGGGMMNLDPNYVSWLCQYLHCYEFGAFTWALETLATIPFHWGLWLDENANFKGLRIREFYNMYTGSEALVDPKGLTQASLLEVMVASAQILEQECFYDPDFDGTYRWFWHAFHNIGFDYCATEAQIYEIAERFMSRTYSPDGGGSMVGPLIDPKEDIRNTPILKQLKIWYVRNFMT